MSLINQMLQELEQRQTASGTVAAQVRAAQTTRPPASGRWMAWSALGLLVVVLSAGGAYYFQTRAPQPVVTAEAPNSVAPPAQASPVPIPAQPAPPPVAVAETPPSVLQPAPSLGVVPEIKPPPPAENKLIPMADSSPRPPDVRPMPTQKSPPPPKGDGEINKEVRQLSARQRAENLYQQAYAGLQQGRMSDAEEALKQALQQDAGHAASRQALAVLMIESNRIAQAEKTLQDGLIIQPDNANFALTLARVQVERANISGALATLQQHLPAGENPDYHAFLAALLQKTDQHKAAIEQYQIALRSNPNAGAWLIGLGISCQADQQNAKALEVFQRARQSSTLSPELQAFVDQRLRQLQ
jgi:MSHA biogenesis protein MshN